MPRSFASLNIYQMNLTGMNPPGRPIGNFLFLGPTGSAKTRIVEAAGEVLLKNPRSVIKIDCAEFQHSHDCQASRSSDRGISNDRRSLFRRLILRPLGFSA
jgi:ATP-dependent Clp protease ATP-binding subunit ClpB